LEISNRIFFRSDGSDRSDRSDRKISSQAGEKTGTRKLNWKPEIQMPDSEIQMLTDDGKLAGAIKEIKRFL
jgi:hypothetical protein